MEYSLKFSAQLFKAGFSLKGTGTHAEEADRAMLYTSLVSIEIALKHLLEKAGVPVKEIRAHSHNLEILLCEIDKCEILTTVGSEEKYVSASKIRGRIVNPAFHGATIGSLLQGESKGASKYPNEVRYGPIPKNFPADLMLECAQKVIDWAENKGQTIRITQDA
jgi:HEPN domain-containing protein